jgi:hypothetical protein
VSDLPLRRDFAVDEPGMIGARWWQDSVVDPVGRRQMLLGILGVGAGVGGAALALTTCVPPSTARQPSLELQRKYGWSFGASSEGLVFDGATTQPFDPSRLGQLFRDLAPRSPAHRPYYVQTLFEAPSALPSANPPDGSGAPPLMQALRPIVTGSMRSAYAWAWRFGELLASAPGVCLVVDLDGEDSVAFAAGACALFDPIFLFDNWPHPRGVVPAHLALAAAAYFQPTFAQPHPDDSPPMFVLDRRRLAPYRDDAMQFDNRWVARMPGAEALRSLGVKTMFYMTPTRTEPRELDDLNDDFVAYAAAGISFVGVALSAHPSDAPSPGITASSLGDPFVPVARHTSFSLGYASPQHIVPTRFGSVPIVVGSFGGRPVGVDWNRSGSWNRGWSTGG